MWYLEAHCGNRPSELPPKMKPSSRKYQARRKLSHKDRYYEKDLISNNKMNHKMVILADYSIKRLILEEQNSPLYKIFPTEVSLLITSHSNMTRRYRLDINKKLIEKNFRIGHNHHRTRKSSLINRNSLLHTIWF